MEGKNDKAPNRIPGLSVYLGPEPERTRRLADLKRMADQLHVTASQMFRMLADGQLSLIVTPPRVATSVQHNEDEKSG